MILDLRPSPSPAYEVVDMEPDNEPLVIPESMMNVARFGSSALLAVAAPALAHAGVGETIAMHLLNPVMSIGEGVVLVIAATFMWKGIAMCASGYVNEGLKTIGLALGVVIAAPLVPHLFQIALATGKSVAHSVVAGQ